MQVFTAWRKIGALIDTMLMDEMDDAAACLVDAFADQSVTITHEQALYTLMFLGRAERKRKKS